MGEFLYLFSGLLMLRLVARLTILSENGFWSVGVGGIWLFFELVFHFFGRVLDDLVNHRRG